MLWAGFPVGHHRTKAAARSRDCNAARSLALSYRDSSDRVCVFMGQQSGGMAARGTSRMAGDWIKMRGALTAHPKVIAVSRELHANREFRDWLLPGGGGEMNGQLVSNDALRCVTCALLMRLWSGSREHGEFVGDDLILRHSTIDDLDQMAGAPGVGRAVEAVGWAIAGKSGRGVTLPHFKEYNVPMTAAEKQRAYRERVTKPLPTSSNEKRQNVTSREEKSREDKKEEKRNTNTAASPRFVPPTVAEVEAYCRERKNNIDAQAFVAFYASKGWMVGKTKMKDWKQSVITWERNERNGSHKRANGIVAGPGQDYRGDAGEAADNRW